MKIEEDIKRKLARGMMQERITDEGRLYNIERNIQINRAILREFENDFKSLRRASNCLVGMVVIAEITAFIAIYFYLKMYWF